MQLVEINELFSKNLGRLRKMKGYSLRELSQITGISHRMIFHYENNPSSIPVSKLKTLADALDARIADFFDESSQENPVDELDVRWIKKLNQLKQLPESDRKEINQHINSLLERMRLKKKIEESQNKSPE